MPDKNSYYCPICGTELESSRELHDHETKQHSKPRSGDASSSERASQAQGERKDRSFERRNWE